MGNVSSFDSIAVSLSSISTNVLSFLHDHTVSSLASQKKNPLAIRGLAHWQFKINGSKEPQLTSSVEALDSYTRASCDCRDHTLGVFRHIFVLGPVSLLQGMKIAGQRQWVS